MHLSSIKSLAPAWSVRRVRQAAGAASITTALIVGPLGATSAHPVLPVDTTAVAAIASATSSGAALTQDTGRVEVLSERTGYSRTFVESDGTLTTELSAGVERVRDATTEDGWREIDLTLESVDGVVRPASGVYDLEIGGGAQRGDALVTLGDEGESIGFGWDGATLPAPVLDGARATYIDVEDGVDLVVEATRYGFEHYLVLKERPVNAADVSIELPVVSDGLSFVAGDQTLEVVDEAGVTVGHLGTAFMWGADGESEDDVAHTTLPVDASSLGVAQVSLDRTGEQQTIVLEPGEEFLEDAEYPVVIDPSVTFGNPSDTYVSTAYPTTNYVSATELMFGTYNSGAEKYRAFLKFSGQPIAGAQIRSASLQLYGHKSYNCSASEFYVRPAAESLANSEITWDNQPDVNGSVLATISGSGKGGGAACPAGWINAGDVKALVQNAADRNKTTFSMRLTASETSNLQWRRVSSSNGSNPPKLVVNYNRHPETPVTPSISGSTIVAGVRTVNTLTPTLSTKATDPDGGSLTYTLEVYSSSTPSGSNRVTSCTTTGVSGATASCKLPAGTLANNTVYWARAVVKDGVSGSTPGVSAILSFKTAVSPPVMADVAQTGIEGLYVQAAGRLLDTSTGEGGYASPMPAGEWRTIPVAGAAGIPSDGTVTAVAVVATVTSPTAGGELRGRPDGDTSSAMLGKYGYLGLQSTSFAAVIPLGAEGTVEVRTSSSAQLILDVRGYFANDDASGSAGGYVPIGGKRIVDTRSGLGAPSTILNPGSQLALQVAGDGLEVPADALAVMLSVTTVNTSTAGGFLTASPANGPESISPLQYAASMNTTIQTPVALDATGSVAIRNSGTSTHLVVDIFGYYIATDMSGTSFTPAAGRMYDSRSASAGRFSADETRELAVAGELGIPPMGSGIHAVTITLTSLGTESATTRAIVWPSGASQPGTTALSTAVGTLRSNTVTVELGLSGEISLRNVGAAADYIIDIQGWYSDVVVDSFDCPPDDSGSPEEACTDVTSESGQVLEVQTGADGAAFVVDDPIAPESSAPQTMIVADPGTGVAPSTSTATSQATASSSSVTDLEQLAELAGFCDIPVGEDLASGLQQCIDDPQSPPTIPEPEEEPGPDPGEVVAPPTTGLPAFPLASVPPARCQAAQTQVSYADRFDACYTGATKVLIFWLPSNKVSGSFTLWRTTRTVTARDSTSVRNDTWLKISDLAGSARHHDQYISGSLQCLSGSCAQASGTMTERLLSRAGTWVGARGIAKFGLSVGQRAILRETWTYTLSIPDTGWTFTQAFGYSMAPRCDNNFVTGLGKGCVYTSVKPVVRFWTSGSAPQTARHIKEAIKSGLPSTLTRTTPGSAVSANRMKACKPASAGGPQRDVGYSCDEYPFASSKQGAASGGTVRVPEGCRWTPIDGHGSVGYSRCMIKIGDNAAGGRILSRVYVYQRVLPDDRYFVQVL